MAGSLIQLKKQDIKNSSGDEGRRKQDRTVGENFKKVGRQYRMGGPLKPLRGAYNIGVLRNPLPTITHKELFWKKDTLIVW